MLEPDGVSKEENDALEPVDSDTGEKASIEALKTMGEAVDDLIGAVEYAADETVDDALNATAAATDAACGALETIRKLFAWVFVKVVRAIRIIAELVRRILNSKK